MARHIEKILPINDVNHFKSRYFVEASPTRQQEWEKLVAIYSQATDKSVLLKNSRFANALIQLIELHMPTINGIIDRHFAATPKGALTRKDILQEVYLQIIEIVTSDDLLPQGFVLDRDQMPPFSSFSNKVHSLATRAIADLRVADTQLNSSVEKKNLSRTTFLQVQDMALRVAILESLGATNGWDLVLFAEAMTTLDESNDLNLSNQQLLDIPEDFFEFNYLSLNDVSRDIAVVLPFNNIALDWSQLVSIRGRMKERKMIIQMVLSGQNPLSWESDNRDVDNSFEQAPRSLEEWSERTWLIADFYQFFSEQLLSDKSLLKNETLRLALEQRLEEIVVDAQKSSEISDKTILKDANQKLKEIITEWQRLGRISAYTMAYHFNPKRRMHSKKW